MGITEWIKRTLLGRSTRRERIPDVIGHVTDERGSLQPIRRGNLKHASLTSDQLRRVARLRKVLAEAYPMTIEGWVDGFLRDMDPEHEIQIIEAVASVYGELTAETKLSEKEKQRLYGALCLISADVVPPDLAGMMPQNRGLPELATMIDMYRQARAAGKRP